MLRKIVLALVLFSLILIVVACAGPMSTPAPTPTPTPPTPAAFQIAELTINPSKVNPGEEVTITAKVANKGGTEGSYSAKLGVNNIAEVVKEIYISAGESQTLNFVVSRDIQGTYTVTLGELAGQFEVIKPAELTQPTKPTTPSCCGGK